jgi:hypothetical protein
MEAGLQDGWTLGRRILPTTRGKRRDFQHCQLSCHRDRRGGCLARQRCLVHEPQQALHRGAGKDTAADGGGSQKPGAFLPYVYALVANVIIAWMLAGLLAHLGVGQVTLRNGIVSAGFLWFGFVLTTMTVNYSFAGRDRRLLFIDLGNWLIVLVVIGAVIGAIGA